MELTYQLHCLDIGSYNNVYFCCCMTTEIIIIDRNLPQGFKGRLPSLAPA